MKKFNLKGFVSPLLAPFKKSMIATPGPKTSELKTEVTINIADMPLVRECMQKQRAKMVDMERKAIALESIIANLRKGRSGLLYYNPTNHSADTIKVVNLFGGWVLVSEKKGLRPVVLSEDEYKEFYGSYILLPLINNLKKV